jgi:hypothetical protein
MCAFLIGRNGVLFWQERVGRLTVASLMRRVFAARRRNRPRRSDRQRLPISERAESGFLLPSWTSALHDVMNLVSHCFSMFYHVQFVCRPRYFMRVWAGDRLPAASGWHSLEIPRPHLVVLSCRVSHRFSFCGMFQLLQTEAPPHCCRSQLILARRVFRFSTIRCT